VQIVTGEADSSRRTLPDVRRLLDGADLDSVVRDRALSTFVRLADAEAAVHGIDPDAVHFHEVGALDAIADIVGACAGFAWLGLQELHASPVALGGGRVQAEHGTLPVPAPAVLELLRCAGAPGYGGPVDVELCTPTGAALLAAWVSSYGSMPPVTPTAVGAGAGTRALPGDVPNVLRLVVGEPAPRQAAPPADDSLVVEANVDDLDPRLWPAVLARLLDAGAADAWLTPILAKKGRPAHTVHALCDAAHADAVRSVLHAETTTIGVREYPVAKRPLERTESTVDVDGRPVRVKVAWLDGRVVNAGPEYDDVAAAAAALGRPVKEVLARAHAAALATSR
jgi:uncharacterized protein (TIGR00299 family) protein